jgi:hypothetical protein
MRPRRARPMRAWSVSRRPEVKPEIGIFTSQAGSQCHYRGGGDCHSHG